MFCRTNVFDNLQAATGTEGRGWTLVSDAGVPSTPMLTDKQAKCGNTVDRRKFAKEHRRLDRMAVVSGREEDSGTGIGCIFAIFVPKFNFLFLCSSTPQMAAGGASPIQSRRVC